MSISAKWKDLTATERKRLLENLKELAKDTGLVAFKRNSMGVQDEIVSQGCDSLPESPGGL